MSKIFTIILFLPIYTVFSQVDSVKNLSVNTEVTIATRNIWRGLDYGSSPSIQGTLSVAQKYFEIGAYGTTTLNGSKEGYGTWLELFATVKVNQFSFTLDDYFFFNAGDSLNNYFEWNHNSTQHFLEARLKWDTEKLDFTAGYAFFKNQADKTNGVYLEAEYFPFKNLSFIVGGLTSGSYLSFYNRGGITTIGASGRRTLKITDTFSCQLKASLIFNPNYKESVEPPGVGTNPVYFIAYLTF
jgi:hypothetical protein